MNDLQIQKLVKLTGERKETIEDDIENSQMLKAFYDQIIREDV